MLKEFISFLKNEIKDPDFQARAIKLAESSASYIEMDKKKSQTQAKKKAHEEKIKEQMKEKIKQEKPILPTSKKPKE